MYSKYRVIAVKVETVKLSNGQEMAHSKRKCYSKNEEVKLNCQSGTCTNTKRTYRKRGEQVFPKWPVSQSNLN